MRYAAIWSFYNLQLIIWDEYNMANETMDVLITSQARTGVSTFAFDGGKSIFNYDNQTSIDQSI